MNRNDFDERTIFLMMVEDLQQEAVRLIGRRLTENEIRDTSKRVEAGLLFDLDNVLRTAVEESVS